MIGTVGNWTYTNYLRTWQVSEAEFTSTYTSFPSLPLHFRYHGKQLLRLEHCADNEISGTFIPHLKSSKFESLQTNRLANDTVNGRGMSFNTYFMTLDVCSEPHPQFLAHIEHSRAILDNLAPVKDHSRRGNLS